MARRLSFLLVLAVGVVAGQGAVAQDRPGECVTRRVTGPGGAYRWDRVECAGQDGWSDFDRWGYQPLRVEHGPRESTLRGDRYGGWSRGYDRQPGDDPYHGYPVYRVAGRDADGFLVWPGKPQ